MIGHNYVDQKGLIENYRKKEAITMLSVFLSGITAGILGVTGFFGFLILIVGSLATGSLILSQGCKGNFDLYFTGNKNQFFSISKILEGALTFVLGWTLAYDSIYLF